MKIKRSDGSEERTVITAMIVNRAVLGAVTARWVEGMFSSRWANLIAGWCVNHYKKYKKPPGKNILTIFDKWSNQATRDKETVQLVEKFLSSLSREYASRKDREAINPDYVIDLAGSYFTKVKQKELIDQVEVALEEDDLDEADKLIKKYGRVEVGGDSGIDVFQDSEALQRAFDNKSEPVIKYEHGLGVFFGDALERDGFIAVQGTEGRGKSWMLLDIAWNGVFQGRKVAMFQVGDMSQGQVLHRLAIRAARIPRKPGKVEFPTSIYVEDGDAVAEVEYETKTFEKGLGAEEGQKAFRRIAKKQDVPLLRLYTYANNTVSIYGVLSVIDNLERTGWTPDIVIIDYADVLAPPAGTVDSREQINVTWKMMRSLSQQLHCLVVTATQAKAAAYAVDTMGIEHFSEDKRKNAHVTGMIGLNQNNAEKERGVIRLNWVKLREAAFLESTCVHVAQCLPLANPCVCSIML